MVCIRCKRDTARKVAEAPDGSHAWEVYFCDTCHYSWRNIEPDYITDPAKRESWPHLDRIQDFQKEICGVPPYITSKKNPATGK